MQRRVLVEVCPAMLARLGVDANRVMVLRTGSNYSMPRPGHTAVESVTAPYIGSKLALNAAWLCGSTVLHHILDHWDTTDNVIPGDR